MVRALSATTNAAPAGYVPLHWASGIWETNTTFDYTFTGGEWQAHGTEDSWRSFKQERDDITREPETPCPHAMN
jgi:hypothetical protein